MQRLRWLLRRAVVGAAWALSWVCTFLLQDDAAVNVPTWVPTGDSASRLCPMPAWFIQYSMWPLRKGAVLIVQLSGLVGS